MNLESRKISLIQEFLRIDNEKIINALENLLHTSKSEIFESNLKPMSIVEFNLEIDNAIRDEESGRLIKANDLKNKIKKWS